MPRSTAGSPSTSSRARAVTTTSPCTSTRAATTGRWSSTPRRAGSGRRRSDTPSPPPCRRWCPLRWRSSPSPTSSRSVLQETVENFAKTSVAFSGGDPQRGTLSLSFSHRHTHTHNHTHLHKRKQLHAHLHGHLHTRPRAHTHTHTHIQSCQPFTRL